MAAVLTPHEETYLDTGIAHAAAPQEPVAGKARYAWALARISLGWVFLWAFVDKLFGLGYATERADAWINGGSPTFGFLNFGTNGPFAEVFASFAGATWADWLFMVGLLGIGLSLMLGIGVRIGAISATVLMGLMYAAAPVLEHNPFMNEKIVYAFVLVGLVMVNAGRTWGFGKAWERTGIVQRYPILK